MTPEFLSDKARQKPVHCPNKIYFCKVSFTWISRFRNKDKAKEEFLKLSSVSSVSGWSLPHSLWGAHILYHCALSVLMRCLLSPNCPPCEWRLLAGSPHPCSPGQRHLDGPLLGNEDPGHVRVGQLAPGQQGSCLCDLEPGPCPGWGTKIPNCSTAGVLGREQWSASGSSLSLRHREGAWGSRGAEADPQGAPLRAPPSVLHLKLSLIAEDPLGFGLMLTV